MIQANTRWRRRFAMGALCAALLGTLAMESLGQSPPTRDVGGKQDGKAESPHEPSPREWSNVAYVKRDSGVLRADVFAPKGDGPYPGVLLIHGGGWRAGTRWTMTRYGRAAAERGFVAVAIDYRLAPRHRFPAPLEDCRDAVRWMKRESRTWNLDPERIAAWGYSAGGHLAALLGVCEEQLDSEGRGCRVRAVVAGGAPCSFLEIEEDNPMFSYFLGGTRRERPEAYRLASPAWFASPDDPPTLFVHGASDWLVPIDSPRRLHHRLKACGVKTRFHAIPECGHIGAFLSREALAEGLEFLEGELKSPETQTQPER